MTKLAKSPTDVFSHPEVSDKSVQILQTRSFCRKQQRDLSATQKTIPEIHNSITN